MPYRALTDEKRRDLTLAALSGEPVTKLAAEYGVGRTYVYKLKEEAIRDARGKYEFWGRVVEILDERGANERG